MEKKKAEPISAPSLENVVEIPVWKADLSPQDVLGHAERVEWKEILVLGYDSDGVARSLSSGLNRANTLWLLEYEKLRLLDASEW